MNRRGVEQGLGILVYTLILIVVYILGTVIAIGQVEKIQHEVTHATGVIWEPGYLATTLIEYPVGTSSVHEIMKTTPADDEQAWQQLGDVLHEIVSNTIIPLEYDTLAILIFKEETLVTCVTQEEISVLPARCAGLDAETARAELLQLTHTTPTIALAPTPEGMLGVVLT